MHCKSKFVGSHVVFTTAAGEVDEEGGNCKDWVNYWRTLFGRVTERDIIDFEKKYVGETSFQRSQNKMLLLRIETVIMLSVVLLVVYILLFFLNIGIGIGLKEYIKKYHRYFGEVGR